jgi:hypothetical protein
MESPLTRWAFLLESCVVLPHSWSVWDTLECVVGWFGAHEQSLAIWLEGLALVAIFGLELKAILLVR